MTKFNSNYLVGIPLLLFAGLVGFACAGNSLMAIASFSDYTSPVMIGKIETSEITESSGLSASECQDVLWTHNDAGNDAFIFGMDYQGRHLGTWKVENARSVDWESIATYRDAGEKCFVLIGDIGDNDEARNELEIYRIPEPQIVPEGSSSSMAKPLMTAPAEVLKYSYADGRNNAETILVHPKTGDIYVVTKEKTGPAGVHRIKPVFGGPEILRSERVSDISVPSTPEGLITGGSFSPDGTRLMLCDKKGGYEFTLAAGSPNPDEIWRQKPVFVNVGDRKQGEGVSYGRDGLTLYASSEKKNAPLFMVKRKA